MVPPARMGFALPSPKASLLCAADALGKVPLFKHGISFRHMFTLKYRKTNFLTNLKSKIKNKIIKMKREHLLFKEAVCKNRISLIKLFVNQNFSLLIFP